MNYKHFYVIPGTEKEFQDYAYKHTDRLSKIGMVPRLVWLPSDLSSDVNPSGVFIGTWKTRKDLPAIFLKLTNKTSYGTDKMTVLVNLWDSIKNDL